MRYAEIILPVARDTFTFSVEENVEVGSIVQVQFGARKHLAGVVRRVHDVQPPFAVKPVLGVLEGRIGTGQLEFWAWLADYYMCTVGEVMAAALPAALRPQGLNADEFDDDIYKPRKELFVTLTGDTNAALDSLTRAPKQYKALLEIAELAENQDPVPRKRLSSNIAILRSLEGKGFLKIEEREVSAETLPPLPRELPKLSPAQQDAADAIRTDTHDTKLLHGVTGSGKTEIYITLIAEELKKGRNVLYLVPEIAMSSQLVQRLRKWFGERVITWHSGISPARRAKIWRQLETAEGVVVLGARSSVLLPLQNLGLVVVDEEHDASFKQSEPAPRYHARDAALVLAHMQGARTLLGSATPSLESYANALAGKFGLVTLTERYGGAVMPRILLSDTLKAVSRGERKTHFNKALFDRLTAVLADKRQAMLFQNRRGFAPYMECTACGAPVMCRQCNVAMTLHRSEGVLKCHYCGRTVPIPSACPTCGQSALEPRGFGTEKVEQELARLLPEARVVRLDSDVASSARRYERVIADFETGAADILVGTQMITKGFDFGGVGLVGILNADNLLAQPDFRAPERAFQTITQVAGRAGRRSFEGEEWRVKSEVVIQTAQPQLPILRQAAAGDYAAMAHEQLAERAEYLYPPYCRLIEITLRARDLQLLWEAANTLAAHGREAFGSLLLGPQPAAVDKIRNEHILALLLKVERTTPLKAARDTLRTIIASLSSDPRLRRVRIFCNPDPL